MTEAIPESHPGVRARRPWRGRGFLAGVVLVGTVLALVFVPSVRSLASTWSVSAIKDRLVAMGPWAWLFSAFLMILQAVISPLPAFVITIANGYVFGAFWGGLLALVSATLAAQLCFEAARALGRPALERWVGGAILTWADGFFRRHGIGAVLVARLLPFVPFDPISYAAGLTTTSRLRFLIANLIGQIPATFMYSTFGSQFEDGKLPPGAVVTFAVLGAIVLAAVVWDARWRRREKGSSAG